MPEQLLGLLKFCLLALVYLFFLRVLWAVWSSIRDPQPAATPAATSRRRVRIPKAERRADGKVVKATKAGAGKKAMVRAATQVVIRMPTERAGTLIALDRELTIGRAANCELALPDDTYLSQLHARLFVRDGQAQVEDLGSTNGTYLNGERVTTAVPLRPGDSVQVGATVLEAS